MQEGSKSADAAHADAMNMRNKQYQKLHGDYQKLSADFAAKRQLASSQAAQLLQLQAWHRLPSSPRCLHAILRLRLVCCWTELQGQILRHIILHSIMCSFTTAAAVVQSKHGRTALRIWL